MSLLLMQDKLKAMLNNTEKKDKKQRSQTLATVKKTHTKVKQYK